MDDRVRSTVFVALAAAFRAVNFSRCVHRTALPTLFIAAMALMIVCQAGHAQCAQVLSISVTPGNYLRGSQVPVSFCVFCAGPQTCICQIAFTASACGVPFGQLNAPGTPGGVFCVNTGLVVPNNMPYGTYTVCASTTCSLGCISQCGTCCECCPCSRTTFTVVPTAGDIDGDGHVDSDDLLAVINSWGRCRKPPRPCPADIAPPGGNGVVNHFDLEAVLANWG